MWLPRWALVAYRRWLRKLDPRYCHAFARIHDKPAFFFSQFKYVTMNVIASARVADNQPRYPVLIFLEGATGFRQMNTFQAEELASHGYIVVAIDQPGVAANVVFPDGHEVAGVPVLHDILGDHLLTYRRLGAAGAFGVAGNGHNSDYQKTMGIKPIQRTQSQETFDASLILRGRHQREPHHKPIVQRSRPSHLPGADQSDLAAWWMRKISTSSPLTR